MKIKSFLLDYIIIAFGCLLLSISIHMFYLPHNLVTGGFSGLSIILTRYLQSWFGINLSISVINLCLNLPLFVVTFFLLGYKMVIRSFYATLSVTFWLYILEFAPAIETDLFLAAIFGGVFSGIGLGLVLNRFSTTGGTDLVAMIFNKYLPHINVSKLLFCIDSCIIVVGLFAFGIENCMYAIIAVFTCTKVINAVIDGFSFAKIAYIITDQYEDVSSEILTELDRGVTGLESIGMYTKKQRVTLMTVVPVKEVPKMKDLVNKIDPNAFIILSDAREVSGEGFSRNLPVKKKKKTKKSSEKE